MLSKKIVIIGASGMLGSSILSQLKNDLVYGFSSKELDITCSHKTFEKLKLLKPDYIINCAAYTAVDLAESEIEKAFKLNAQAVGTLSQIANLLDATLIHFSTDYVFNGLATVPYLPKQTAAPINVYGASKRAGEIQIQQLVDKHYIFRVSWLYAPHGKNFFRWVAESTTQDLTIVDTQTGSPTSTLDVASFIQHLITTDPAKYGTYHLTNKGEMTWYAFAKAINENLQLNKNIQPIPEFKTAAKRPTYSVMDVSETEFVFDYSIPSVIEGLESVIKKYKS